MRTMFKTMFTSYEQDPASFEAMFGANGDAKDLINLALAGDSEIDFQNTEISEKAILAKSIFFWHLLTSKHPITQQYFTVNFWNTLFRATSLRMNSPLVNMMTPMVEDETQTPMLR